MKRFKIKSQPKLKTDLKHGRHNFDKVVEIFFSLGFFLFLQNVVGGFFRNDVSFFSWQNAKKKKFEGFFVRKRTFGFALIQVLFHCRVDK